MSHLPPWIGMNVHLRSNVTLKLASSYKSNWDLARSFLDCFLVSPSYPLLPVVTRENTVTCQAFSVLSLTIQAPIG